MQNINGISQEPYSPFISFPEELNVLKAFKTAVKNSRIELIKQIIADSRFDPSREDNYAIKWASSRGYWEAVNLLLTDGRADPCADDNYAIRMAALKGHAETVKVLLTDGRADPTENDNIALSMACALLCLRAALKYWSFF